MMLFGVGAIVSTGLGLIGGFHQAPAVHAAQHQPYHIVKSVLKPMGFHWNGNQHAYLWNGTLTQKRHRLGNYPKGVFSSTEYLKMTNGTKTGYFYHVTGPRGIEGYVWRGYVTPVDPQAKKLSTKPAINESAGSNKYGLPDPSPAELADIKTTSSGDSYEFEVAYWQDKSLYTLFPGTLQNADLADVASAIANEKTDQYALAAAYKIKQKFLAKYGLSANDSSKIKVFQLSKPITDKQLKELYKGTLPFKTFVQQDLKAQGINPADYKGWSIGVHSYCIDAGGITNDLKSPKPNAEGRYTIALFKTNRAVD